MILSIAITLVIISSMLGAIGQLFFKMGAKQLNTSIKDQLRNYKLMLGFFFYFLSTAFFIPALKGHDPSVIYPFVATNYVWISLLSWKVLKEEIHKDKLIGIALITLGLLLIGIGR